ncbi:hypothetical protein VNO77_37880 [Canavalia gladiata]|uniref:Uncharacterized protein n=1 Tax=Canavalia gladiata TaxID=3824 RepID=A0AAN9KAF4_CANGL
MRYWGSNAGTWAHACNTACPLSTSPDHHRHMRIKQNLECKLKRNCMLADLELRYVMTSAKGEIWFAMNCTLSANQNVGLLEVDKAEVLGLRKQCDQRLWNLQRRRRRLELLEFR